MADGTAERLMSPMPPQGWAFNSRRRVFAIERVRPSKPLLGQELQNLIECRKRAKLRGSTLVHRSSSIFCKTNPEILELS